MEGIGVLQAAVQSVQESPIAFSKYITANDVGSTGGHQSGFHIHKNAWPLFFDKEGKKGQNKDKFITIKWQADFETSSRVIYYGVGTRNEYRLTRFGRGFPFLNDDNIGDLLVISRKSDQYYEAFVLKSDEDIDDFFTELNISPSDTNSIIPKQFERTGEKTLIHCFSTYLKSLKVDFPSTLDLATSARNCYNSSFKLTESIIKSNPDKELLAWLDAEFQLFKTIEGDRYSKVIETRFKSVEDLVDTANTILNRRKSRAGKSLEHHLAEIFRIFKLKFSTQSTTEDRKRPDFIFPNVEAYLNARFDSSRIIVLASKTTCKDRWRQVLNEADRVKTKHLFTLQQGISKNQLDEMYKYKVCLVVPKGYLQSFPEEFRSKILTLSDFIGHVLSVQ